MRWYINIGDGSVAGPFEESDVIASLLSGHYAAAYVLPEGAKDWRPVTAHPPFAAALLGSRGAAVPLPAAPATSTPKGATMSPAARYLILAFGVLVLFVMAKTPTGMVVGIGLVLWGFVAHRKQLRTPIELVLRRPPARLAAIATGSLGALMLIVRMVVALGAYGAAQNAKQEVADAQAKRDEALRGALAELPAKINSWRPRVTGAWDQAAAHTKDAVASGMQIVSDVQVEEGAFAKRLGAAAVPPDLTAVSGETADTQTKLKGAADILDAIDTIDPSIKEGRKHAAAGEWISADDAYAKALGALQSVGSAADWLKPFVPSTLNAEKKSKELGGMRASIAGAVAAQRKREEKKAAERREKELKAELYATLCGASPGLSVWDGALIGLESALKETANDPASIDVKNCTAPRLTTEHCWISTCDVRGKNVFGGMVLNRATFSHSTLGFEEVH
jgi:hypothetical protein